MSDWRELMRQKRFVEAEILMLNETENAVHGQEIAVRADFYERWGDAAESKDSRKIYYEQSLADYRQYASGATGSGEGLQLLMDVERVEKKIARLDDNDSDLFRRLISNVKNIFGITEVEQTQNHSRSDNEPQVTNQNQMSEWRRLMEEHRFEEAALIVEAEYEARTMMGNETEDRAWFYERWGDYESDLEKKKSLYETSLQGFEFFASCSSSGGEGTARMREVKRLRQKLAQLNEI